jgi:hypothetical protein
MPHVNISKNQGTVAKLYTIIILGVPYPNAVSTFKAGNTKGGSITVHFDLLFD